ncbi:MAG: xanthine dehydrogenase family protein molybdopterin-binding subunit [Actinomycetota bacterium]
MTTLPPSFYGIPVLRAEDPRFLRGEGRYLENIEIPGALRALFVRSIMAHAALGVVDVSAALEMPGVVAVLTAADVDLPPQPASGNVSGSFPRPLMARDRVRFVGEPLAMIVAETQAQALDAAEAVRIDYDPLDVVTDPEAAAREGAPLLFPDQGSNIADTFGTEGDEDPLTGADVVVRGRFVNQRLAPAPMEPNAIAVVPDDDGSFTVWVSTQVPFDVRNDVAEALGVERSRVRAIAPDVGGGFGAKLAIYPEYLLVAVAAQRLGRAVRWFESRSESMVSMTHGRGQVQTVALGASRDGRIVGLDVTLLADMGAYPQAAYLPPVTQEMLCGVYDIPKVRCRGASVVTNATPIAPYRGAGRPEAAALIERAVDMLADELDLDPAEVRRRNLIPSEAFPFTTAVGTTYDVGEYAAALDEALRIAGYDRLRAEQRARRERGDHELLGIGLSTYVEITAFAEKEFGSVEVTADGAVRVLTGISPHGQGHETSLAQIVSGVLQVPFESVRVIHSDTGQVPRGNGTYGSRSLQLGGSAVFERSQEVLAKGRRLAAHALEVDEADVSQSPGGFHPTGAPDRAVTWRQVAELATAPPDGEEPGLLAQGMFREAGSTFPFGAHVAVVEVDLQTGDVRLIRHVAVDDCGRILNPMLVDGQVHGGLAQGIAQALFEEVRYDELGNPMSSTFTGYLIPSAAELPWFETHHTQTPTPLNPLGAKGIGESATIGSTPAIQNAAVDALAHLGIRHLDLPLSPERVWSAVQAAAGAPDRAGASS